MKKRLKGRFNLLFMLVFVVLLTGCRVPSRPWGNNNNSDPSEGPLPGDVSPEVAAKFGLYGFASVPTAEFPNGTTGGAGGEVSYVSNGVELQAAIDKAKPKYGSKPQIVYVQGEITKTNSGDAKQIDIKDVSNVSVIGVGTSAVFNGIGINIVRAYNIIVQNVTVHHNRIGQKDAISIQSSGSHIWIDHCELYNSLNVHKDYYDELLSAKNATEYITFSWNYLHDSWKTSLIGSSDSDIYDRKITYHHNLIENCNSRLPSYRGGTGHIYNNYYKGSISTCINSRVGAKLLIQNNYFENCKNPIGTWYSEEKGYWYQEENIFDNCTTTGSSDTDSGPTVPVTDITYNNTCEKIALPYSVPIETAGEAKGSVLSGAGVGKISGPGGSAPVDSDPIAPAPVAIVPTQSISGTGQVTFTAEEIATGFPIPEITMISVESDPTIAIAVLAAGEVTVTGVAAGTTEMVVTVANEAGEADVTVPIRVVGADPLVPTISGSMVILNETFASATADNFWTADYKAQSNGLAMYYPTGNQSSITFTDGQMTLAGARFAIGQTDPVSTGNEDTDVNGSLDLSKNWKIQIYVISGSGSGNFQVQVDNNTTSGKNSIHGDSSRIFSEVASELSDTTITISSAEKGSFTPNSFLFLRTESKATVVTDQILVEIWE